MTAMKRDLLERSRKSSNAQVSKNATVAAAGINKNIAVHALSALDDQRF
jgi:hypothetical protein